MGESKNESNHLVIQNDTNVKVETIAPEGTKTIEYKNGDTNVNLVTVAHDGTKTIEYKNGDTVIVTSNGDSYHVKPVNTKQWLDILYTSKSDMAMAMLRCAHENVLVNGEKKNIEFYEDLPARNFNYLMPALKVF